MTGSNCLSCNASVFPTLNTSSSVENNLWGTVMANCSIEEHFGSRKALLCNETSKLIDYNYTIHEDKASSKFKMNVTLTFV